MLQQIEEDFRELLPHRIQPIGARLQVLIQAKTIDDGPTLAITYPELLHLIEYAKCGRLQADYYLDLNTEAIHQIIEDLEGVKAWLFQKANTDQFPKLRRHPVELIDLKAQMTPPVEPAAEKRKTKRTLKEIKKNLQETNTN